MHPGDIYLAQYLAQFPFGDVPGMKLRPVLLLTGPIGAIPEVLVAYISSYVASADWRCGSHRPSYRGIRQPEPIKKERS
jgi:hypothetical protein